MHHDAEPQTTAQGCCSQLKVAKSLLRVSKESHTLRRVGPETAGSSTHPFLIPCRISEVVSIKVCTISCANMQAQGLAGADTTVPNVADYNSICSAKMQAAHSWKILVQGLHMQAIETQQCLQKLKACCFVPQIAVKGCVLICTTGVSVLQGCVHTGKQTEQISMCPVTSQDGSAS